MWFPGTLAKCGFLALNSHHTQDSLVDHQPHCKGDFPERTVIEVHLHSLRPPPHKAGHPLWGGQWDSPTDTHFLACKQQAADITSAPLQECNPEGTNKMLLHHRAKGGCARKDGGSMDNTVYSTSLSGL